jgi:hypothetical protein
MRCFNNQKSIIEVLKIFNNPKSKDNENFEKLNKQTNISTSQLSNLSIHQQPTTNEKPVRTNQVVETPMTRQNTTSNDTQPTTQKKQRIIKKSSTV